MTARSSVRLRPEEVGNDDETVTTIGAGQGHGAHTDDFTRRAPPLPRGPIMQTVEPLLGIPVGLALSTAAGLRVLRPAPAHRPGRADRLSHPDAEHGWLASDAALVAFGTATVLEVGAYYVPWLDNVLDTVATPRRSRRASSRAAVTPELLAARALDAGRRGRGRGGRPRAGGDGAAAVEELGLHRRRRQPVIATGELAGSLALSALGLLAPLLAAAAVVVVLVVVIRRLVRRVGGVSRPP